MSWNHFLRKLNEAVDSNRFKNWLIESVGAKAYEERRHLRGGSEATAFLPGGSPEEALRTRSLRKPPLLESPRITAHLKASHPVWGDVIWLQN